MTTRPARLFPACLAVLLCAACNGASEGGAVLFDHGYVLETFATNADGISSPDGLAWHDGNLYIADEGGSAIRRIGPEGLETLAVKSSGSPEDLAIAPGGKIYFTDDSAGGVWTIADGRALRITGSKPSTEGIAIAPDGRLLVGEPMSGGIRVYRPTTSRISRPLWHGAMAKPESIAFDAAGDLYVADNEDEVLYHIEARTGERVEIVRREGFSPESISMIGNVLWITDSHNGKLYRLGADGRLETVALFGGELSNVSGIAGDPQGNVYISIQSDIAAGEGLIVVLRHTA